ncbi:MAG: ATP-binding protein [Gemmatimonadaceae bacterium]
MKRSRLSPSRLSMQLRLTLWNALVLGFMLSILAISGWLTLRRVLRERGDATIKQSAAAIARAVVAERRAARARGDTARVPGAAARDVLSELRTGDLDIVIVDDDERVVAANAVPLNRRRPTPLAKPVRPAEPVDPELLGIPPQVRELLRIKPDSGVVALRTLLIGDLTWRAALVRVNQGPITTMPALVVGVLRSDEEDLAVLARVRTTLLLAIPFAVILTLLAGFTLARRSLAPINEMAAAVERISAATLNERLTISNPHDELGRLGLVINDLLGRVDSAFRAMKQFVADASHELRTPIAIVRGEADVTLQLASRDEASYRETLHIIRDESVRLSRIVDDLFLLARTDAERGLERREPVDLAEKLTAVLRSVRSIADDRKITLQLNTGAVQGTPVLFSAERPLIRRLILNLLDNAFKHTPSGGTITITIEPSATQAVFTVCDTGPGIPEALRERLFDRFVRATPDMTPSAPVQGATAASTDQMQRVVPTASGAGLGLAIAQAIAHAHGGQITLDASTTGACFRVTLPRLAATT